LILESHGPQTFLQTVWCPRRMQHLPKCPYLCWWSFLYTQHVEMGSECMSYVLASEMNLLTVYMNSMLINEMNSLTCVRC
jgi:hypothetical protein